MWEGQPAVTGFEDGGRKPLAKENRQLVEAEKSKKPDSPLECVGRNASWQHFDFNP